MDLNGLRVFLAVAESGSVSAAAKRTHYVQSNITAHIKKLEQELGVVLFMRESRGMRLTSAGFILQDYAERLLHLASEAKDAVRDMIEGGGALRIGSMETAMAVRLPPMLKQLHAQLPKADIRVQTGRTQSLIEQVLTHKLDCAFIGGEVHHPNLVVHRVFEEELVLLTPKNADERALSILLVFRSGCIYRDKAEQWMREQGRIPYKIMEYGALEGIVGCVDAGLGCTLVPRRVVENKNFMGSFNVTSLPPHIAQVTTHLVYRNDTPVTQTLNTLLSILGLDQEVAPLRLSAG